MPYETNANPSPAERNRAVALDFLAGTHSRNIRDVDVIDRTVAETIVCHGFPGGPITNREDYKEFFRTFRKSFDDMDYETTAIVADDRHVAARWRISATHVGTFAGVEPDERRVTFEGMVLYRFEDGLIAETWLHIDELGLLSQIGALSFAA